MSEMTDASIAFYSQLNMYEKKLYVCGDEWEPGEYVVKVLPGVGAEPLELTHERVIRCRDCKFSRTGDVRFYEQALPEPDAGCCYCAHIMIANCQERELDGFCAWAKPKEES